MGVLGRSGDVPFALLLDLTGGSSQVTAAANLRPTVVVSSAIASAAQRATTTGLTIDLDVDADIDQIALPAPSGEQPAGRAQVIPLGREPTARVLVLGISPRLAFDSAYRRFFELVGALELRGG